MYQKEYEQVLKVKMKTRRKNIIIKSERERRSVTEKEKADEDKTDQKLPSWIKVSKSRFNEINNEVTKNDESKLMSRVGKKNITLNNPKELLKRTINKKIDRKEAKKCIDDAKELGKLRLTSSRKKNSVYFSTVARNLR